MHTYYVFRKNISGASLIAFTCFPTGFSSLIRHGTVGTGALGRPDDLSCGHNEIVFGTLSRSWGRGQVEGGNWEE